MIQFWRVGVTVPQELLPAYQIALEPFMEAVSATEKTPDSKWWEVVGYTRAEPAKNDLEKVFQAHGLKSDSLEIELLPKIDWLPENRKSFKPIDAGQFFIYSSAYDGDLPQDKICLKIEAATAFGTGNHATTYGCLLALDKLILERPELDTFLDMGCGTGILAIAMAKLWKKPVMGSDIDPEAVRIANENFEINEVPDLCTAVVSDGYDKIRGEFDIITANILPGPLCEMAPYAARVMAPKGLIVLSGLLAEQEEVVVAAHQAVGLKFVDRIARDGWHVVIMQKG